MHCGLPYVPNMYNYEKGNMTDKTNCISTKTKFHGFEILATFTFIRAFTVFIFPT